MSTFASARAGSQAPAEDGSHADVGADAEAGEPRSYTAAEVDAAIEALGDPERLSHAQEVVTHAAPALQRILAQALHEGGWFGGAHRAEVQRVAGESDVQERVRAVDLLVAEQTRLGMFVGVTVGFQLARELEHGRETPSSEHEQLSSRREQSTTETEEP